MKATKDTKKLFEVFYKERGYKSMKEVATAAGLNYANLSRVMGGTQSEGSILVRLARFFDTSYKEMARTCGFCGTEGEVVLSDLDNEFQAQRGNTNVVGNHNNVGNNIVSTDGISDDILNAFAGVGGLNGDLAKRFLRLMSDNEALKKENEMKDRQIAQLEKDKMFYQTLLEKR